MKTVIVKPMKCEFTDEGILWIDKIATGVGVIIFNAQKKFAAGFHILRGLSKGQKVETPAYFADTAVEYVIQEFGRRGIPLTVSIAIAGGASLLEGTEKEDVGLSLVRAVKEVLSSRNLAVKLENVGGNKLRTMILNVDEGRIKIS